MGAAVLLRSRLLLIGLLSFPFASMAFLRAARPRCLLTCRPASSFISGEIEKELSAPRVNKERLRRLVYEAVGNVTVELKNKELERMDKELEWMDNELELTRELKDKELELSRELKDKELELMESRARLGQLMPEVLRLKGMLDMRGTLEEIIGLVKKAQGVDPSASWRADDWERLFKLSPWRSLEDELVEATGWRPKWVPGKLEGIYRNLSARAHDVGVAQGQQRQAVVISTKVLSGEECRALGALCKRFDVPFVYDGLPGYVNYNDLFTGR